MKHWPLCLAVLTVFVLPSKACIPRAYGFSSFVCVCNSTVCDFVGDIKPPPIGQYLAVTTSKAAFRFHQQVYSFNESVSNAIDTNGYVLNRNVTFQRLYGFGGAFTDAAGIGITSLSENNQDNILR